MPGISSTTDSNYNYFKERLTDLEESMDAQKKSADESRARDRATNEARTKEVLERKDRETEKTIQNVRENSSESLARERENAKRDREEILKTTYNRIGRYGGLDPLALKEQVRGLKDEVDLKQTQHDRNLKLSEEDYHRKLEESERRNNERLERTAEDIKDTTNRSYSKTYQEQNEQYAALRDESEERYRALAEKMNDERAENQRRINSVVEEYDNRSKKAEKERSDNAGKIEESYRKKMEDTVRTANRTAAEANHRSQESMRKMQSHLARYGKETGQGTAEVLEKYEHENRTRAARLQEDHEAEMVNARKSNETALRHNEAVHASAMQDKDDYLTHVTRQMANEAYEDRKEIIDTHDRATEHMKKQHVHDQEVAQRSHENQLTIQNQQHASTLESQGRAFQRTLARNQEAHDTEVERLQARLDEQRSTADPTIISPAAYEQIRASASREHKKELDAEHERNKRSADSLHDGYQRKYAEILHEKETNESRLRTETALERHLDRKSMLAHLEETEFQKNAALRKKDVETYRESQNLNRNFASSLEKQRQGYDELINLQRNDISFKLNSQKQEADFELRRAQRAFAARETELVQSHENKMQQLKTEMTAKLDDAKFQGQIAVREGEQRAKQMLEEQARSYEQKIARMEEQHKEHERYLKDNFDEQMEKLKRSYDLNNKKKG